MSARHGAPAARSGTGTGTPVGEHVVIVGNGMAGGRLVEEVLARQADGRATRAVRLTLVGAEPYGSYNRVLLSEVLAGRAELAGLELADPLELRAQGVDVRLGARVLALELPPAAGPGHPGSWVRLDDGSRLQCDRVVLATGARAHLPALAGLDPRQLPAGVHLFRSLDDCREIVAAAGNARRAVVLGGGLLGLEAARGLARRGLPVTVVHPAPHVLERQLDPAGGGVLARALSRLGITVRAGAQATGIEVVGGRLSALRLAGGAPVTGGDRQAGGDREAGGERLAADLLVIACGVRPRTELAAAAGLAVGRGVRVDDTLGTGDPRVLAIGDCAEHDGVVTGLVAPAWEQARVVADRLTGAQPAAVYRPRPAAVRLKAADLEVAAIGDTTPDPWTDEPGLDVVQLIDPGRGRYVKAVIRSGTVVGGIAVGAARAAAELAVLVERAAPAPLDRSLLLLPGNRPAAATHDDPTLIPDRATICRCNGVDKAALVGAWRDGARSRDELAAATRAGTGCGTCTDAVDGILGWLSAADPDPDPAGPAPVSSRRRSGPRPAASPDPTPSAVAPAGGPR